jgi:hypothetical protein
MVAIPGDQVRGRAVGHGVFPKRIPFVALKASPCGDFIPDGRVDFLDAFVCTNRQFRHACSVSGQLYISLYKLVICCYCLAKMKTDPGFYYILGKEADYGKLYLSSITRAGFV